MPRRSTGCEKCRQRKVKCDEERPRCRRCRDYGVDCPGYRPPLGHDIHFVDQTNKIVRQAGAVATEQSPQSPSASVRAREAHSSDRRAELRWRHQFSGDITSDPTSSSVNNRHLHRVQLLSTFLDLYLPKRRDRSMMSHFTYVTALPAVDMSSPLLQISIDTLCLAELGSLYDDRRCLEESRSRYVRALPMLMNELAKPQQAQLRKDHILAVISLLALCELFDALARGNKGGKGWVSHAQGAQTYFQYHHKEIMQAPFGWLIFHNIRHMAVCMSMVARKASFFADPYWLNLTQNDSKKDSYVALYDITVQVSGMFERADNLAASHTFDEDFSAVCRDLIRLRDDMDRWLHFHFIDKRDLKYTIVDVRDMKEFTKLCPNRTFITVFRFSSIQISNQFQLFWTTCLMVDFTLTNIYYNFRTTHDLPNLSAFTSRTEADIERDMYVAAASYCRSVPYCCEPETTSIGRVGTFLLRITTSFFDSAGHARELKWCADVRAMLQGSSPAAQSTPTSSHASPSSSNNSIPGLRASSTLTTSAQSRPVGPITLEGEYPSSGYTPRTAQSSISSTLHHLPSDADTNDAPNRDFRLPDTSEIASRLGVVRLSVPARQHINGASVLADERAMDESVPPDWMYVQGSATAKGNAGVEIPPDPSNVARDDHNDESMADHANADAGRADVETGPTFNLEQMKTAFLHKEGVNVNCDEGFLPLAHLDKWDRVGGVAPRELETF